MFFVKRAIRTEDHVINALYYVTFFIHLMICYYFANTELYVVKPIWTDGSLN